MNTVLFVVLYGAFFANPPGLKSQLSYVDLTADKDPNTSVVRYRFILRHPITQSVNGAEVNTIIHALDVRMNLPDALNEILSRIVEMEAFEASRSLLSG